MEENFTKIKKSGMTVPKAWLLNIAFFISMFVVGIIIAVVFKGDKEQMKNNSGLLVILGSIVSVPVLMLVSFFINNKELPYFKSFTLKDALITIVASLGVNFLLTITENVPYILEQLKDSGVMYKNIYIYILSCISSVMLFFLFIAFIGHGLIKNYKLSTVLITFALMSLVSLEPKVVMFMASGTIVGIYIYFKTQSAWLVLIFLAFIYIPEIIFVNKFGVENFMTKNTKDMVFNGSVLYYIVWVFSLVLLGFSISYFKKKKEFNWRNKVVLFED